MTGAPVQTHNPATGAVLAEHPVLSIEALECRLQQAHDASVAWGDTPLADRAPHLRAIAGSLETHSEALARLMTAEMGKPLAEARSEVAKCAWVCRFYAEEAAGFLAPQTTAAKVPDNAVVYEPLGPILSIMPWNFPLWQVLRFAAPALMAGNAVLVKHAPNTAGTSARLAELILEAGLPAGLLQDLPIEVERVEQVVADDRIKAVTVTGSERAGRAVAALAGRCLKPSVLELGGSDPFVVLADADLEAALDAGVASRCLNAGQSCIAAKRFIVEASVHDAFVEGLLARMSALVVGDPTAPETDLGPLARPDLVETLHSQVQASVSAGACLRLGGAPLPGPGNFYPPTVLTHVPAGCPAASEELFGPVASVFRAHDPDDAIRLANQTRYGLSASLWTQNRTQARTLASRIRAGGVFVNQMSYSDPRLPFGGIGLSGYGRELGREGILAFVNTKTVSVG